MSDHDALEQVIKIAWRTHRDDPFKRLAPQVIEARQEIEVWVRESTAGTYVLENDELNLKYKPEWVALPG